MRVICTENKRNSFTIDTNVYDGEEILPLIIGKSYVVYALINDYGHTWLCIYDEECSFPTWHPLVFFEIQDRHLSRFWLFGSRDHIKPFFSFKEWVEDEYFYNNLVNGEEKEYYTFQRYKNLMDLEFPDSSVKETAQIGDEVWLMCPSCIDAWEEPDARNAMVICPNCKTVQHNPRYKNELPSYLKKLSE